MVRNALMPGLEFIALAASLLWVVPASAGQQLRERDTDESGRETNDLTIRANDASGRTRSAPLGVIVL